MSDEPVVLINLLKVEPAKQEALIALLNRTPTPWSARLPAGSRPG
jgi:hypothetical protein